MTRNKGFTLIELLIVIGVLGILAAGLMAAVDPFEQLKKARDANNRNAVIELHNATTRYYATHGGLPWDDVGVGGSCVDTIFGTPRGTTGIPINSAAMSACIVALEGDGELKTGFVNAVGTAQASKVYVNSTTTTQVIVCFPPEGKGLWKDASTKYDSNGVDLSGVGGACGSAKPTTPDNSCFWCAR